MLLIAMKHKQGDRNKSVEKHWAEVWCKANCSQVSGQNESEQEKTDDVWMLTMTSTEP